MSVKKDKLQRSLGGISEIEKIPDLVFIIDTNYESLAIQESVKLVFQSLQYLIVIQILMD